MNHPEVLGRVSEDGEEVILEMTISEIFDRGCLFFKVTHIRIFDDIPMHPYEVTFAGVVSLHRGDSEDLVIELAELEIATLAPGTPMAIGNGGKHLNGRVDATGTRLLLPGWDGKRIENELAMTGALCLQIVGKPTVITKH